MTKEKVKFLVDNNDGILDEISQKLDNLSIKLEIDDSSVISVDALEAQFEEIYRYCSDIFEKYNIDFESYKILKSVEDKDVRLKCLNPEENSELLRDIVDLYGNEAYEILECNSRSFKLSDVEGLLLGNEDEKYREFYRKLVEDKCQSASTIGDFIDVLKNADNNNFLSNELVDKYLEAGKSSIIERDIDYFINNAPDKIVNKDNIEKMIEKTSSLNASYIIDSIPEDYYDEKFSNLILSKTTSGVLLLFSKIPEEARTNEIWNNAIDKEIKVMTMLPEKPINDEMTEKDYIAWMEEKFFKEFDRYQEKAVNTFYDLKDFQKTDRMCLEVAKTIEDNFEHFLSNIPDKNRSRELYEILLEKSDSVISQIPRDNFDQTISQQEYDNWVDDIIVQKISKTDNCHDIFAKIPRERINERVWNALLDRVEELKEQPNICSLENVPVYNIIQEMCDRAYRTIHQNEIFNFPVIDKKIETIDDENKREEYKKWISSFSEEEKANYRDWYEDRIIGFIQESLEKKNIFYSSTKENKSIPDEAITINIIKAFLEKMGPYEIKLVPEPNELTTYNEQYEDIIIYAISMIEPLDYATAHEDGLIENKNILEPISEKYRTSRVIEEAIKKRPKYLDYVDMNINDEKFDELLDLGYKRKLESLGRTSLTDKEKELIKKFRKNNSSLFSTLKLDSLSPEIVECIGENSLEKIVRYLYVQSNVIDVSKNKAALTTFGFVLQNLGKDELFIEPLVEKLSRSIDFSKKRIKIEGIETPIIAPSDFIVLVADKVQNHPNEITDEEKSVISYLVLHPELSNKIKSYDEIVNYVDDRNVQLDNIINSKETTLIDIKSAYLERIVGITYEDAMDLTKKYGNDPEKLLAKYEGKNLDNYRELAEKESLEAIIKIKSIIEENDLESIKEEYYKYLDKEDKNLSDTRYSQGLLLDNVLKRAYGRDITQSLSKNGLEHFTESVEHTEDGQEYTVRKLDGPFNRLISVMNAYRKNDAKGDMYDRWNTAEMAENHALCYSFINEENPGTAMLGEKKGVMISINGFKPEAVTAVAPYDLSSDSRENTTKTMRQQRYFTLDELANQTRGRYSELDVEIQDVSEGTLEYKNSIEEKIRFATLSACSLCLELGLAHEYLERI